MKQVKQRTLLLLLLAAGFAAAATLPEMARASAKV